MKSIFHFHALVAASMAAPVVLFDEIDGDCTVIGARDLATPTSTLSGGFVQEPFAAQDLLVVRPHAMGRNLPRNRRERRAGLRRRRR